LSGPIAPNIFEPPRLETTNLAAKAPAPILTIWSLFVLNALDKVVNATPGPSLPSASFTALPAFAASRNARPAPVSIKLTEKVRFLRELLFALRSSYCHISPLWGCCLRAPQTYNVFYPL